MEKEFNYNMQLKKVFQSEALQLASRETATEKTQRLNRISQQNTEQSKLINQRKNNLPPHEL